jgi:hypothetical protein
MALNLWKINGNPTSYSQLPTSSISVPLNINNDYTFRIRAKSPSGGRVSISNNIKHEVSFTLTADMTTYEATFKPSIGASSSHFLNNRDAKTDIVVESIELVQKPLSKLTINGIDGFKSGKWTLHANAVAVDDETLVLNATGAYQTNSLKIPVIPNQNYVLSVDHTSNTAGIWNSDMSATITNYQAGNVITFNSGSNSFVNVVLGSGPNSGVVSYTFKRPMLNLGSIPAPYEKKRGDKMVMPVAKKNLFPVSDVKRADCPTISATVTDVSGINGFVNGLRFPNNTSTIYAYQTFSYTLGKTYVYSVFVKMDDGSAPKVGLGSDGTTDLSIVIAGNQLPSNSSYLPTVDMGNGVYRVSGFLLVNAIPNSTVGAIKYNTQSTKGFTISGWQFEEGTTPSVFTPYAVQVNPKPKKWVPKKNLFDGQLELGAYRYSDGVKIITSTYARSVNPMMVTPSRSVSLSMAYAYGSDCGFLFFDKSMSFISSDHQVLTTTVPSNAYYMHINIYGTNAGNVVLSDIKNVQVEYGTATPFEPYQLVTPRAKTGLSFNGLTDYLQLPSMTMDSVEIECLIDSVQSYSDAVIFQSGTGALYSRINNANGSLILSATLNGSVMSGNIPSNSRNKLKYTFAQGAFPLNIFANGSSTKNVKGTLYKVTCYLNNAIVAQYDFENNRAMAGNSVVPVTTGAPRKNLVPTDVNTWEQGSIGTTATSTTADTTRLRTKDIITLVNGKNYVVSCATGYEILANKGADGNTSWGNPISFTAMGATGRVVVRKVDLTTILPSEITNAQPQLEEGSTPTAYSPYLWQTATNPLNLIPSFEDTRWSIHANAKVLGRDVLHLDATGVGQQSTIDLDILPNVSYLFKVQLSGLNPYVQVLDANGVQIGSNIYGLSSTFTSASNAKKLRVVSGYAGSAGSFDFIRPQLYQLSGKEGTLNGTPTQLNKHAKRRLYAKR